MLLWRRQQRLRAVKPSRTILSLEDHLPEVFVRARSLVLRRTLFALEIRAPDACLATIREEVVAVQVRGCHVARLVLAIPRLFPPALLEWEEETEMCPHRVLHPWVLLKAGRWAQEEEEEVHAWADGQNLSRAIVPCRIKT